MLSQVSSPYSSSSPSTWPKEASSLSSTSVWTGGAESDAFNRLEKIALDWKAQTPVLGCRISRALDSRVVGSDYLPSRINWVVQSSAVDYLHLLLVAMRWACRLEGVEARFLISIHDEVRYLVRSQERYRAARALQLSNLLVRAMFCSRLGLADLPESVAYFSGVDVDLVMRKDPLSPCRTPSEPGGVEGGRGVPPGECLDVRQVDRKAKQEEEETSSMVKANVIVS